MPKRKAAPAKKNPSQYKRSVTVTTALSYAVELLENSDEEPETAVTRLENAYHEATGKLLSFEMDSSHLDSTDLTAELLMSHPSVQKAFKKFCENVVGTVQYCEELADELHGNNSTD